MGTVFLDPTGRCNLRCRHCYAESRWAFQLEKEELFEIIRMLPNGIDVGLIGGEVMVREDICKIIEHCVRKGHRTTIATNATLITPDVAESLLEAGVASVSCSLDGPSPQVHDALRGAGAFRRAMKGIHCLNDTFKTDDALTICFTVHSGNYCHVEETLELLDREGIFAQILLERAFADGKAAKNKDIIPCDKEWLLACEQACQGWKRWRRLSTLTFLGLPRFVRTISERFAIVLNGSSYVCPVLKGDIFGRIFADGKLYSCGRRDVLDEAFAKGILPEEGQLAMEVLAKQEDKPWPYPSSVAKMRAVVAPPDDPFCKSCPDRNICTNCPVAILLGRVPKPSMCVLSQDRYGYPSVGTTVHQVGQSGSALMDRMDEASLRPGVYWKELRSGAIQVFVPVRLQSLRLASDAAAVWKNFVTGVPFSELICCYEQVAIIDELGLDIEVFFRVLERFGAVECIKHG